MDQAGRSTDDAGSTGSASCDLYVCALPSECVLTKARQDVLMLNYRRLGDYGPVYRLVCENIGVLTPQHFYYYLVINVQL